MKRKRLAKLIVLCAVCFSACVLLVMVVGNWLEQREYKLEYRQLIAEHAAAYELDPYLVAAIIHCESSNKPGAVSVSGAIGLMQIMPETGAWIAQKLACPGFSEADLYDPAINVRMGCWYLDFLLDTFGGNRVHAIAAYNAGQGAVAKWLADDALSRDGQLVQIPYAQTKHYVEKVQRAYEKYVALYPRAFAAQ